MSAEKTVTIGGVLYDASTGLRVEEDPSSSANSSSRPAAPTAAATATAPAHVTTRKSSTLKREYVKKPAPARPVAHTKQRAVVERSPMVSRFAAAKPRVGDQTKYHDIAPAHRASTALSPVVHATHSRVAAPNQTPVQPARHTKNELLARGLSAAHPTAKPVKHTPAAPKKRHLVTAALALVLLGGYLTYINMPGLAVGIAASQSGVAATFPDYHPSGYRFVGPVAFNPGEVRLNFQANGGTQHFQVKEIASSWNSQAVVDNYVRPAVGDQFATNQASGLTIYTFANRAAWVSGGVFYTIDGTAPLSTDQLLHMAASM